MGQPRMTKSEDTTALIAHDEEAFLKALAAIPTGYSEGDFNGRRWGATIKRSPDLKRIWLFAEDFSGSDIVSFNLYGLEDGRHALKPCEMSSEKVVAFVLGWQIAT
ncbi:hypothetical protein EV561_101136 [Rhizobium sp. BK376]|nr:hypothetical protein EV561_101136 [Rhizobium sp. BK376]